MKRLTQSKNLKFWVDFTVADLSVEGSLAKVTHQRIQEADGSIGQCL